MGLPVDDGRQAIGQPRAADLLSQRIRDRVMAAGKTATV